MIFDENYDRALWLLLAGDKNNREKIAECIKKIPGELYYQIHLLIEKSYETDEELSCQLIHNNYLFEVIISDGVLTIKMNNTSDEFDEKTFQLSLDNITREDLVDGKLFSKKHIGKFVHVSRQIKICETCGNGRVYKNGISKEEYSLIKNPLASYVERERKTENFYGPIWNTRVSLNRIPDKMYLHQLDTEKRLNRLVREKIKNS